MAIYTRLKNRLSRTKIVQQPHLRIINYSKYIENRAVGKALLSYLPKPVYQDMNGIKSVRFSNAGIAVSWAKVLNKLGYEVDVVSWDDNDFTPKENYDLFVAHGGVNFDNIYDHLTSKPPVICFSTGSYWKYHNQKENERIADFNKRHDAKLMPDRPINHSEQRLNDVAKGIIVLGDESMKDTYPEPYKVWTINNASYTDEHFDNLNKDYQSAKNNFLFYAGSGNIHKGLDLLIDAFKGLKQHLFIVTIMDDAFAKCFVEELKLPNIHFIGEVSQRSTQFYEVMDKCGYIIFPSCSEGQAGSVVECINQGLVPIVTKETRLDATNYGYILKNSNIQTIRENVSKASSVSSSDLAKLSHKARNEAVRYHSPTYFEAKLFSDVRSILG